MTNISVKMIQMECLSFDYESAKIKNFEYDEVCK